MRLSGFVGLGRRVCRKTSATTAFALTGSVTSSAPTSFVPGQTHQITYNPLNPYGVTVTPVLTAFATSNAAVATVNGSGLVTAVDAGTCTITLTIDSWIGTATYTVETPQPGVNNILLTQTSGNLSVGQQVVVIATARDVTNVALPSKTITVSSANSAIASVSPANGGSPLTVTITGAGTGGPIDVTFTSETKTAAYAATVTAVVQSGYPYTGAGKVASNDWNNYADKAALTGLFGVEGNLNQQAPVLGAGSFYDLVSDGTWGKVVRYLGDPALNTTATTSPGRIAIHKTATLTPALSNVWVRQFRRFSTNWVTSGANPTGGASYKTMFLHWNNLALGGRLGWLVNGSRESVMELFQGAGASRTGDTAYGVAWATAAECALSIDFGRAFRDFAPQIKVGSYHCAAGVTIAGADGDGEWYELLMHYKIIGTPGVSTTAEGTIARFRYTTGGVVRPASERNNVANWQVQGRGLVQASAPVASVVDYQMGVNRNKQWDEVMSIDYGPYEVVDGVQASDPFGVGSIWAAGGGV